MRRSWGRLIAVGLVVAAPNGATAQVAGECYDVVAGTWEPIDSTHIADVPRPESPDVSADSVVYALPPRLQLSQRPSGLERPGVFRLEVPAGALPVPHRITTWRTTGDSLELHVSTGFAGSVTRLVREGSGWAGVARSFTDVIGVLRFERPIRLRRVDCASPPPVPASVDPPLPRVVTTSGGATLALGDTLPDGVRTEPRSSGALRVHVEVVDVFAGADTVVAVMSPDRRLGRIELRYPGGFDLSGILTHLRQRYGPGRELPGSGTLFWSNRTTGMFVSPDGPRPRLALWDPRLH
jgi:hypothetical protein